MTSHNKKRSKKGINFANAIEEAVQEGRLRFDENGKVKPSQEDFELVEREHPSAPDAEKYRLAQATALLRAAEYPT